MATLIVWAMWCEASLTLLEAVMMCLEGDALAEFERGFDEEFYRYLECDC